MLFIILSWSAADRKEPCYSLFIAAMFAFSVFLCVHLAFVRSPAFPLHVCVSSEVSNKLPSVFLPSPPSHCCMVWVSAPSDMFELILRADKCIHFKWAKIRFPLECMSYMVVKLLQQLCSTAWSHGTRAKMLPWSRVKAPRPSSPSPPQL